MLAVRACWRRGELSRHPQERARRAVDRSEEAADAQQHDGRRAHPQRVVAPKGRDRVHRRNRVLRRRLRGRRRGDAAAGGCGAADGSG
eukprot:5093100-Prymnesium_polylepis.1